MLHFSLVGCKPFKSPNLVAICIIKKTNAIKNLSSSFKMLAAEAHLQARELVDVPELPPNVTPPGDHDCVFFYDPYYAGESVHLTQQPTSPGDIYYG